MPGFTFLLTNPMLGLDAKKESEKWILSFDAKIRRPERYATFKIFLDGKEYDGYETNSTVFIECHPSRNEAERLSLRPPNEWSTSTEQRPGYLTVYRASEEKDSPTIGIGGSLPFDAFFRLHQASVNARSIELSANVDGPNKEGFSYGLDPDGGDIEWRVKEFGRALLQSLELGIKSRSEDALESESTQEARTQESQSKWSEAAETSKLVNAVNRLFWAVVIIGLLLVIKAL